MLKLHKFLFYKQKLPKKTADKSAKFQSSRDGEHQSEAEVLSRTKITCSSCCR